MCSWSVRRLSLLTLRSQAEPGNEKIPYFLVPRLRLGMPILRLSLTSRRYY